MHRSPSALLLLAAAAAPALGQSALHSNGSTDPSDPGLSTGAVTASGVVAPIGASWSELQGGGDAGCNAVAGFSGHYTTTTGAFRFADDFAVPASGYRLDRLALFLYHTGPASITPPVGEVNLRIWDGPPGEPASSVVFGDAATDRLVAAAAAGIYRVFSTTVPPHAGGPDLLRPIWRAEADLGGLVLGEGTYWLDWQYLAANPDVELFTPPVTVPGVRAINSWNAMQLRPTPGGESWLPLLDPGKPAPAPDLAQDLPFILLGGVPCAADWDGDAAVNSSDISAFLLSWLASVQGGSLEGDFSGDGAVNSSDISAFLLAWLDAAQNGC